MVSELVNAGSRRCRRATPWRRDAVRVGRRRLRAGATLNFRLRRERPAWHFDPCEATPPAPWVPPGRCDASRRDILDPGQARKLFCGWWSPSSGPPRPDACPGEGAQGGRPGWRKPCRSPEAGPVSFSARAVPPPSLAAPSLRRREQGKGAANPEWRPRGRGSTSRSDAAPYPRVRADKGRRSHETPPPFPNPHPRQSRRGGNRVKAQPIQSRSPSRVSSAVRPPASRSRPASRTSLWVGCAGTTL